VRFLFSFFVYLVQYSSHYSVVYTLVFFFFLKICKCSVGEWFDCIFKTTYIKINLSYLLDHLHLLKPDNNAYQVLGMTLHNVYLHLNVSLGAFTKLPKETALSCCLSICPSVRMDHLSYHGTDVHEIWYLSIFRKCVKAIKVWLKSDKNNS
jgi:hypothetical protein